MQDIGDIVVGSVLGDSSQRAIQCRVASLLAGIPETVPVHTVNRCGPARAASVEFAVCEYVSSPSVSLCARVHAMLGTCALALAAASAGPACARRQCSSGLQAIASVAASIKAGFYTIGLAGGVETMSLNPMAWGGGVNSKLDQNQQAADCLLPMGARGGRPQRARWPLCSSVENACGTACM